MKSPTSPGRGFTITELLVVIAVIVVLLGLLFPALAGIRRSGLMAKSMSNMRQVGVWMGLYSTDNRDFIVPSQFNYRSNSYPGKVRSVIMQQPLIGREHAGTWADILWTVFEIGVFPDARAPRPDGIGHDYKYDSPDGVLYRHLSGTKIVNPLRSAAPNSRSTHKSPNNLPRPYGPGASEAGLAGYFAANNFFNADPDAYDRCLQDPLPANWYTNGQIKLPERSMYLVDSFAGEIIQPRPWAYQMADPDDPCGLGYDKPPGDVDFRYSDACLMLFLDAHVEPVGQFDEICDLEGPRGRGIRIRELTRRSLSPNLCQGGPPPGGGGPGHGVQ
jgi:prepilin-type N-terminal cleavage/methylation domain-containing protein